VNVNVLHDKQIILTFLKRSQDLQIYCIGDLDDFFWPKTIWYGLLNNGVIEAIALLYVGMETPTILAFEDKNIGYLRELLKQIKALLPKRFFAHLSPGLIDVFGKQSIVEDYGLHLKMALRKDSEVIYDSNIRQLNINDLPYIQEFYKLSYPQNWFDMRMLETQKYFGYFIDKKLVGISGVHVYSAEYKVAALGNVATNPIYRGQGIAYKLTTTLCHNLQKSVDSIGLNVKADNDFAIRCYQKVGFEEIGKYDECLIDN
jgi:ribosomal protein S18 acetylase RimI-like enzyme